MELLACVRRAVPFAAMVTVECTDVGFTTVSKAAMTGGMSFSVLIVYYNALGSLILLPFVITRRKLASLTFSLQCRFFVIGLIGSLAQLVAFTGLQHFHLLWEILFPFHNYVINHLQFETSINGGAVYRIETLDLRSSNGVAVSLGALISVLGVLVITLYKGPDLLSASSFSSFPHHLLYPQQSDWVLGGFLLAVTCLLSSILYIFQEFPEKMTNVFFFCFFSTILCSIFALIVERRPSAWRLNADVKMLAVFYCVRETKARLGIFGVIYWKGVHTRCLLEKGPVYVSMFKPLGICRCCDHGGYLHRRYASSWKTRIRASAVGAIISAIGFYTVMRGKVKEANSLFENGLESLCLEEDSETTPLQNHHTRLRE